MPGTIVFRPLEANIVSKDKDILGKMDPYLSFHLGGLKRVKGEVAKSGGQHPVWNDAITVEVTNQTSLTVDLKDKDMLIDDKIGSFEVDLRELAAQGQTRKWYPIFRKNEPAGELLMEAVFSGVGTSSMGTGYGGSYPQGQSYPMQSGTIPQNQHSGFVGGVLPQGQNFQSKPIQSTTLPQTTYGGITHDKYQNVPQNQYGGFPQYGSLQGQQGSLQQGGFPQGQYGGLQQGGFQQGGLQQGGFQQGGLQQGGFPQGQYGGLQQQPLGTNIQPLSSEQFAKEAILRGSDPLNTQSNYVYNTTGQVPGQYGQNLGQYQGQNLTQTPTFSGTDPLLYEGDKNRFSHPPQQVPYNAKTANLQQGNLQQGNLQQGNQPGFNNPNTKYY